MMKLFEKVLDTKAFESPVRLHQLSRKTSADLHSTKQRSSKGSPQTTKKREEIKLKKHKEVNWSRGKE